MLSKHEGKAERGFDELHVRAETGLGAEVPIEGAGLRDAHRPRLRRGEREPVGTRGPANIVGATQLEEESHGGRNGRKDG